MARGRPTFTSIRYSLFAIRGSLSASTLAAVSFLTPPPAAADCTCRALGRDFEVGRVVCLSIPGGPRLATCGMVLNNTSWQVSDTPCVVAEGDGERVGDVAANGQAANKRIAHSE